MGVCLLLGMLGSGAMVRAESRTVVLASRLKLKVERPMGYSCDVATNEHGMTMIVMENPVWNIVFKVFVTPNIPREAKSEEWQQNMVITQSAHFMAESKEGDYHWRPLNPRQGSGLYAQFGDAAAKSPADLQSRHFMYVIVGAKVVKGAGLYFQIFSNEAASAECLEVLNLLVESFEMG